jgi:enoyl reductase-like protein
VTARAVEGRGVRVVFAGGKLGDEVYDSTKLKWAKRWTNAFGAGLVKTKDGKIHIDTPFSRLLSKPPLMVAGMTPSTVQAGFNAAVLNAGFHIELAGGGHYNEKSLRGKVAEIMSQLERPGAGITLNALYINQRQWSFQVCLARLSPLLESIPLTLLSPK